MIDRLEESLLAGLPRLIETELSRGLIQQRSIVGQQIAGRLNVRADTTVNKLSPVISADRQSLLPTPVTAVQLLHSGQINSAFEMVNLLPFFCTLFGNRKSTQCKFCTNSHERFL